MKLDMGCQLIDMSLLVSKHILFFSFQFHSTLNFFIVL